VWMSHGDSITALPAGFTLIADTQTIPVAIFKSEAGQFKNDIRCLQFHPEVTHTLEGEKLLNNFVTDIAGCSKTWTPASFIDDTVAELKTKLGDEEVILGLSGGVDSSVAALLLDRAIGKNLTGIFVNNGLLRKNEFEEVLEAYKVLGLKVRGVDASEEFLSALDGISDPEQKRKIIGRVFIEVFEAEAKSMSGVKWLAQGTIYPDVIESVSVKGPSATIKSHHNVGGLPDRLGMAIRVLGALSKERLRLNQEADHIFINLLKESGWYDKVWQAGTILLPVKSVGVMGDERTYEYTLALRAVLSHDGMTAEWSKLPYELLGEISNQIINKVRGINRVVYDISTKPPATIEWE